tara:strand:+ start:500 stop:1150 length:651 start_codon:yes stop_codon:yes gene_type:complete
LKTPQQLKERLAVLRDRKKRLQDQRKKIKQDLAITNKNLKTATEAHDIIITAADATQRELVICIENAVNESLDFVFGADEFKIVLELNVRGGRLESVVKLDRNGIEVDPLTEMAGGVIDIAALAARVALLSLVDRNIRRVIVLDEPFQNLSEKFQQKGAQMLNHLATHNETQIIIVTHVQTLITHSDRTLHLIDDNGTTRCHQNEQQHKLEADIGS